MINKPNIYDMKQTIFCFMVMALILGSCQMKRGPETISGQGLQVADQLAATAVENRVKDIYDDVFDVYNAEDSLRNIGKLEVSPSLASRSRFTADYCSREWNGLLAQINEIDSLYHQGEMGFFDDDYWIMAQDWHDLSISDVKALKITSNEALVGFQLHNLDAVKPVEVMMVNEDGVWKINNFLDPDHDVDLMRDMREYVAGENAKHKK